MASRGPYPSAFEGHSIQPPGMMRHGPFPGVSPDGHRSLEHIFEAERLTRENRRLAATQVDHQRELVAAQQEVQRLKAHIGSTQTESDIQIRILLEKIKKMEADI
ncbi:hypothetical protein GIB67_000248 [Kingdonia uniflora]|uniref:Uncharacterized protein n=1 Tax=Kingdonia uniflora TaxID=39325 RepID=A0A7J7LCD7_9MAGN|nr:hypothetical protein GIB67_000248 [Kingdonia uniflora]